MVNKITIFGMVLFVLTIVTVSTCMEDKPKFRAFACVVLICDLIYGLYTLVICFL